MFSSTELEKIEELAARRFDADQIARELGIHPSTLERKLLKGHGIVLERVRACRLTPLQAFVASRQNRNARSGLGS